MKSGAKKKSLTEKEKEFARLLADRFSANDAARKVFGWKCERFTSEELKARSLAQSKRVKEYVSQLIDMNTEKAVLQESIERSNPTDWENLHIIAFERLKQIRDDPTKTAKVRYEALLATEKLSDPSQDINLIRKYIESVWYGLTAHCPCCHSDFPLSNIETKHPTVQEGTIDKLVDRRLYLLDKADKRRTPRNHPSQMKAIAAPERSIVGQGIARGGKSFLLAQLGLLHLLLPGGNVWILARTYDDARWEFEYIQNMLYTMFYPVEKHVYTVNFDKKTGDARIQTKWGSELEVRSGKAKGSVTGQELDAILVAEPGWVDAELFEEVRARMSSRLGRIFAFGTPKGFGNFLGRMMRTVTHDMRTGKKLSPGSRLIENGAKWGESLLHYQFVAKDNPSYVTSEIEAAKSELTEHEFASEFEGQMVADSDRKFPFVRPSHMRKITHEELVNCAVTVGVDQGTRNFGSVVLAWDGHTLYCIDEYFDSTGDYTIKSHLIKVNHEINGKLMAARIPGEKWTMTIFDTDPKIDAELEAMKRENKPWKTPITFKPKNEKDLMNWRDETCQFLNQLAKEDRIVFCSATELLMEDMMEVQAVPDNPQNDYSSRTRKGWLVSNKWRGDHVLDALLLATWTIYQSMIIPGEQRKTEDNLWEYLEKESEFARKKQEIEELKGYAPVDSEQEIHRSVFGYDQPKPNNFSGGRGRNWYPDA